MVRVEDLGKQYQIGAAQSRHKTFRETLMDGVQAPWRRVGRLLRGEATGAADLDQTIWALRDVSFTVAPGEVVGVIGRNGAGKSTLLRILSRITEPTCGIVAIRGRVGSLLEVGTGFHSELTGRENVFLSGAILGMKRVEIDQKFDEIVDFAGVAQFIDTPVKHYSTGMYLRLAFAVAAHLEPEILLVDEVLAVGDAAFQKKCLGKMRSVARTGRTVVFVSHNMAAINTLCSSALVLDGGRVVNRGATADCVSAYLAQVSEKEGMLWQRPPTRASGALAITRVEASLAGEQPHLTLTLAIALTSHGQHKPAFLAADILDGTGVGIMQALPRLEGFIHDETRHHTVTMTIDLPPLVPGQYAVTIWAGSHNTETLDVIKEAIGFEIVASPTPGRTYPHTPDHGYIVPVSSLSYDGE